MDKALQAAVKATHAGALLTGVAGMLCSGLTSAPQAAMGASMHRVPSLTPTPISEMSAANDSGFAESFAGFETLPAAVMQRVASFAPPPPTRLSSYAERRPSRIDSTQERSDDVGHAYFPEAGRCT